MTDQQRLDELADLPRHPGGSGEYNSVRGLIDLCRYIQTGGPARVLELGACNGVSTEVFAILCESVVTVDLEIKPCVMELTRRYGNVCAIGFDSLEAHFGFENGEFDFVYLDTLHTYDHVRREIELYSPKVRPRGYIGGHDFTDKFPGVGKAVREIGKPHCSFSDGSWIVQL